MRLHRPGGGTDEKTGEGTVGATEPIIYSATGGLDIGRELGTPATSGQKAEGTVFSGEIKWVELSVGDDDHSHLIEPDDFMHMLMSKQ